ncbi:MAG: hypothetical protein HXS48_01745 [Theionarchaea archaeon]|nr:hypothetical protein [Theionarchaea archaeon]
MSILGRPKGEDLTIGSSQVENFLVEVRTKKYTGYLKIECRNLEFLLFYEEGVPTHGFRVIEDELFSFSNLSDILSSLEGGKLSFFEASPGALQALFDMKFGDQIYGNLYTSYCDLGKLFQTLQQEKHTGSVEIDLPSLNCFVLTEEGVPTEVVFSRGRGEKEGEIEEVLHVILEKAAVESGIVKVFERRNPLTIPSPDPEEIFTWSDPRRLKLEFAFGQLGKEFEKLLDQNLTISQILNTLCVDFVEIADMYTYLSVKGYIVTKKGLING